MGNDGKVTTVRDEVQFGDVYKEFVVSLLLFFLVLRGGKCPPFMFAESRPKEESSHLGGGGGRKILSFQLYLHFSIFEIHFRSA